MFINYQITGIFAEKKCNRKRINNEKRVEIINI